ncbi:MAG: hypothetical protein JWQ98_2750 [Chlorobi bacterium]|nr:hypothetical protein [Chlorobiota bacterium]
MLLCPVCLHALGDEDERCPFCSAEIERDEREELGEEIDWVIVRTVNTEIQATLIAGRLRAHNIPAFVISQVDSSRGFTIGALAVAKVYVPDTRLAEATEILATPEMIDDLPSESSDPPAAVRGTDPSINDNPGDHRNG